MVEASQIVAVVVVARWRWREDLCLPPTTCHPQKKEKDRPTNTKPVAFLINDSIHADTKQ